MRGVSGAVATSPASHRITLTAVVAGRSPMMTSSTSARTAVACRMSDAVAGHAGMTCATPNPDYGIDLTIHEVRVWIRQRDGRKRFGASGQALDIQVKSTARVLLAGGANCIFELDVDSYKLSREAATPRILVVHVQPRDERLRLEITDEGLLLRGQCYWIYLQGYPEVLRPNARRESEYRRETSFARSN